MNKLERIISKLHSCRHVAGRNPAECHMCYIDMNGGTAGISQPLGRYSDMQPGSPGNISQNHNFNDLTDSKIDTNLVLTERYDYSGHESQIGLVPHLNQSIEYTDRLTNQGYNKTLFGGITSNKTLDGFKGLGESHIAPLFPKDEEYYDE